MRLKDRVAVVTGGVSGIGFAMTTTFLKEGASVVMADVKADQGKAVEEKLKAQGFENVKFILTDLTNEESIKNLMDQTAATFGSVDVLCNNAAVCIGESVEELSAKAYDIQMNVNVRGAMLAMKYAVPYMKERGKGSIVNTASICAMTASPNQAPYTASKGAIVALTRQVAYDYAKFNIRCNAICPSDTRTEMFEQFLAAQPDPEATKAFFVSRVPLGRVAEPEEQANVALFLASDDSSFVTGQSICVDGGYSIW